MGPRKDPVARQVTSTYIMDRAPGGLRLSISNPLLDRQVIAFTTPELLHAHTMESVERLNSPKGGLMMKAEVSGTNVPLKNIEAICGAMETASTWSCGTANKACSRSRLRVQKQVT